LRLRRFQRLGADDVAAALKSGKTVRADGVAIYIRSNGQDCARIALIVSKKLVPTAVARNRVRRLAREAFRLQQGQLAGRDCVVRLTRPEADAALSLDDLKSLMTRAAHA